MAVMRPGTAKAPLIVVGDELTSWRQTDQDEGHKIKTKDTFAGQISECYRSINVLLGYADNFEEFKDKMLAELVRKCVRIDDLADQFHKLTQPTDRRRLEE